MSILLHKFYVHLCISVALKVYVRTETTGTAKYCEMFDTFFDCLNVCNTTECITKQKPFLSPYTSVDDERFEWLMSTFLPYFTNWKNSTESRRGGPYSNTDKARLFTSSFFYMHKGYKHIEARMLAEKQ